MPMRRALLLGLAVSATASLFTLAQRGVLSEERGPFVRHYLSLQHRGRCLPPLSFDRLGRKAKLDVAAEIGVNYSENDGGWNLTVNDNTSDTEYKPRQASLIVPPAAKTVRPAGTKYDFLGANAGDPVWVLPQFQRAGLLYLAVSAEDTPAGTFTAYDATTESGGRARGTAPWIRWQLLGMEGPGAFSVWGTGSFGKQTVWMATSDGIDASDAVWVPEGDDLHLNWGFSKPGHYHIVGLASGYLPGHDRPSWSFPVVYDFDVQDTAS